MSLPHLTAPVGSKASFSSSLGIAKTSFVSALAHSSNLKEGEFFCRDAKFCVSTGILISLDPCHDAACEGNDDGWGERDGAVALTVGLIFCALFYHREKCKKNAACVGNADGWGGQDGAVA